MSLFVLSNGRSPTDLRVNNLKAKRLPLPYGRTRIAISDYATLPYATWRWTENGVLQGPNTELQPSVQTFRKITSDVVVPGYAQRVAAGEIISNPYSMVERKITREPWGDTKILWTGNDGGTSLLHVTADFRLACGSAYGDNSTLPLPNYSEALSYAQTKALAGVQAAELQSLVTLGEFRETMRMLVSPMRALTRYIEDANKRYKRDLARYGEAVRRTQNMRNQHARAKLLRLRASSKGKQRAIMDRVCDFGHTLTDAVLGYNLGWKPFMMDIDAILNKIPSLEQQERRTSRSTREVSHTVVNQDNRAQAYGTAHFTWESTVNVNIRASVLYADKFETSQHFGYRLQDLPEAAWELLPLSFLVDYAVNVGDYLGALRAMAYANILSYSTVIRVEGKGVHRFNSITPGRHAGRSNNLGVVQSMGGGSEELTLKSTSRSVDSFGPSFAFGRPGGERPASHVQNVASLLTKAMLNVR